MSTPTYAQCKAAGLCTRCRAKLTRDRKGRATCNDCKEENKHAQKRRRDMSTTIKTPAGRVIATFTHQEEAVKCIGAMSGKLNASLKIEIPNNAPGIAYSDLPHGVRIVQGATATTIEASPQTY